MLNLTSTEASSGEEEKSEKVYEKHKVDDLIKEIENANKEDESDGSSSAGSDSEPSEDNLSDSEMYKLIPKKAKKSMSRKKKDIFASIKRKRNEKLKE